MLARLIAFSLKHAALVLILAAGVIAALAAIETSDNQIRPVLEERFGDQIDGLRDLIRQNTE